MYKRTYRVPQSNNSVFGHPTALTDQVPNVAWAVENLPLVVYWRKSLDLGPTPGALVSPPESDDKHWPAALPDESVVTFDDDLREISCADHEHQ